MENKEMQRADEHFELPSFVLSVFYMTMYNFVVLIGDNTATNQAFTRKVGPLYNSCRSHRISLAVQHYPEVRNCVLKSSTVNKKRIS